MKIFVSIASYRDPQLVPTIEDCLSKATLPAALRFGICWQRGPDEVSLPFSNDRRFRIKEVDWRESAGTCWARAEIMKLWDGEEFFLQLDSHHRFCPGWDVKLLYHAQRTGSAKPIITTYGAPFTPGDQELFGEDPMQINFDRFSDDGIPLFKPGAIADWRSLPHPIRARFISAHFLFTSGQFVSEVPYDPDLYFLGEEITLSVRAFTNGYDLFHPPEHILWHEYSRSYRRKHWDDHIESNNVAIPWHKRDSLSKDKVRRFLSSPAIEQFGCGTIRTITEYQDYTGMDFVRRLADDHTRSGLEPPNPTRPSNWAEQMQRWTVRIQIDRVLLNPAATDDCHFWYVGVHDLHHDEIRRWDISDTEVRALASDRAKITIVREFDSYRTPMTWTVWPVSHSRGWLQKLGGAIQSSGAGKDGEPGVGS